MKKYCLLLLFCCFVNKGYSSESILYKFDFSGNKKIKTICFTHVKKSDGKVKVKRLSDVCETTQSDNQRHFEVSKDVIKAEELPNATRFRINFCYKKINEHKITKDMEVSFKLKFKSEQAVLLRVYGMAPWRRKGERNRIYYDFPIMKGDDKWHSYSVKLKDLKRKGKNLIGKTLTHLGVCFFTPHNIRISGSITELKLSLIRP